MKIGILPLYFDFDFDAYGFGVVEDARNREPETLEGAERPITSPPSSTGRRDLRCIDGLGLGEEDLRWDVARGARAQVALERCGWGIAWLASAAPRRSACHGSSENRRQLAAMAAAQ